MTELKPRLIITSPGRKRRGFGGFFILILIFALGFYAGSKYGDYIFGSPVTDISAQKESTAVLDDKRALRDEMGQSAEEYMGNLSSDETPADTIQSGLVEEDFFGTRILVESGDLASIGNDSVLKDAEEAPDGFLTSPGDNKLPQSGSDVALENQEQSGDLTNYTLQVGAFSTPEEAQSVAETYKNKGYNAYIVPIENSKGEKWNLVKIGKFSSIDQAWSYSSYFEEKEGLEAYVETVQQDTVFNESWGQHGTSDKP